MASVLIDNKPFDMDPAQNLLHGCLSLGFDLPYFCWHPAMGSVGACRQCAVKQFKDEHDQQGKLVMACMTPAAEGTRISIDDPDAVAFRRGVIEGLMLSHPHDCPVCDEGGECHLQDMTLMTGHDYRRYSFEKRTWRNQYLGPFLNHEMNRCIQCYRCVRFYREYAGGHDFNSFSLRNVVYFGRERDGVLENEFAGNLAEVCPTGVFTDKTLGRHYTRKWDLQFAPSVCTHCGIGCNTQAAERYKLLRRVVTRYNHEVNGYFLCDRGRFGYEFVNSPRRIREPLLRGQPAPVEAALEALRGRVAAGEAIGIGSPRASLEANFALRALVGPDRFFAGMEDEELRLVEATLAILRAGPARTPSLREIELADAALVLGEDVTNTAPLMALRLRQTVRQQPMRIADKLHIPPWMDHGVREAMQGAKGPLFVATPRATRLDEVATRIFRGAPVEIARLGFAVARALDPAAAFPEDIPRETAFLAGFIAEALVEARQPVVIAGTSLRSEAVIQAAANVARALQAAGKRALLSYTVPECNTMGLAMMGARPLGEALDNPAPAAIVLENDLYRRAPAGAVDQFLGATQHLVALDSLAGPMTEKAELVLPAGTFAESDGTYVNHEGRAQRFFQVFVPEGHIQESWRWLAAPGWRSLDQVIAAMAASLPVFARVPDAAPPATFRMAGEKIPREPHRFSGRTAMLANITVHEPKPPDDPDSPLAFSMEGNPNQPPAAAVPFFWAPRWNSIQSLNKFQEEVGGPLRGGPTGVRLIEPDGAGGGYFNALPPPFEPRPDEFLVMPLGHIFGSDELSSEAPAISELSPEPYVALNPADAARLHLTDGSKASVGDLRLAVRLAPDLPPGLAGVHASVPLPHWVRIAP